MPRYAGLSDGPRIYSGRIVFLSLFLWGLLLIQFYSASVVGSLLSESPRFINTLKNLSESSLEVGIEDMAYNYDYLAVSVPLHLPLSLSLFVFLIFLFPPPPTTLSLTEDHSISIYLIKFFFSLFFFFYNPCIIRDRRIQLCASSIEKRYNPVKNERSSRSWRQRKVLRKWEKVVMPFRLMLRPHTK